MDKENSNLGVYKPIKELEPRMVKEGGDVPYFIVFIVIFAILTACSAGVWALYAVFYVIMNGPIPPSQ